MERKVLRQRSVDEEKELAKKEKLLARKVTAILKKETEDLSKEEKDFLEDHDELAENIRAKLSVQVEKKDRMREWEDDLDLLRLVPGSVGFTTAHSRRGERV